MISILNHTVAYPPKLSPKCRVIETRKKMLNMELSGARKVWKDLEGKLVRL